MTLHLVIDDDAELTPAARSLLSLAAYELQRGSACRLYASTPSRDSFAEPISNLAFAEDSKDLLIWHYAREAPEMHLAERFPGIRALLFEGLALGANQKRQLASLTHSFERVWVTHQQAQRELSALGFKAVSLWPLPKDNPSPDARDALLHELAREAPLARTIDSARVSVVICTLNRAAHLESCLNRLKRQRFPRFEVIVVNGPSTDGTEAVLQKFAGSIKIRRNPKANLCVSRNLGIAAAAGEIIAFLDDDSFADPEWMQEALAAFDDPLTTAVGGLSYRFRDETVEFSNGVLTETAWPWPIQPVPGSHYDGSDGLWNTATGNNCLFRRDALLRVGGFDERIPYTHDESNVILQMARLGMRTRHRPLAIVHHGSQPSLNRRDEFDLNWKVMVRDSIYCGYRNRPREASRPSFLLRTLMEHAKHRLRDPIDWFLYRRVSLPGFFRIEWQCVYGLIAGTLKALFVKPQPLSAKTFEDGREAFLAFAHEEIERPPAIALLGIEEDRAESLAAGGVSVHILGFGGAALLDSRRGIFRHTIAARDDAGRAIACWRKLHELAVRADVRVVAQGPPTGDTLLVVLDPRFRMVTPNGGSSTEWASLTGNFASPNVLSNSQHANLASIPAEQMTASRAAARWRDPVYEGMYWSLAAEDGIFAEAKIAVSVDPGQYRLDLFAGLREAPRETDPTCQLELRAADGTLLQKTLFDGSYFGDSRWAVLSTAVGLSKPQASLTVRISNPGFTTLLVRRLELHHISDSL